MSNRRETKDIFINAPHITIKIQEINEKIAEKLSLFLDFTCINVLNNHLITPNTYCGFNTSYKFVF